MLQLLLGDDVDELLQALTPDRSKDAFHLLERIDMTFNIQMSIVADALNLTRFKVAGKLASLAVNVSNSKYQGLMRLIDVAIPHFDGGDGANGRTLENGAAHGRKSLEGGETETARPNLLKLPSNVFASTRPVEYVVDDHEGSVSEHDFAHDEGRVVKADKKASIISYSQSPSDLLFPQPVNQRTFQFSFQVDRLQASLSKTNASGVEMLLADALLEHFELDFALETYQMMVDIMLR